jgi:hypothetical protein
MNTQNHELFSPNCEEPNSEDTCRPSSESKRKALTLSELKKLPPLEWLIEGILHKRAVAELFGQSGLGKSFLALDWALTIATDKGDWLGHPTGTGKVYYVAAEGVDGLPNRIAAWMLDRGASEASIEANFFAFPEPVNLLDDAKADELIEDIQKCATCPVCIIIDTLARCLIGGDENNGQHMGRFVHNATRIRNAFTDATILIIHHPPKSGEGGGRGHSSLLGAIDAELELKPQAGKLVLTSKKQRNASKLSDIHLQLAQSANSAVIAQASPSSTGMGSVNFETNDGSLILEAIAKYGEGGASAKEIRIASALGEGAVKRGIAKMKALGHIRTNNVPTNSPRMRYFLVEDRSDEQRAA